MSSKKNHYDNYFNLFYQDDLSHLDNNLSEDSFQKAFVSSQWYKDYRSFITKLYPENMLLDTSGFPETPIQPKQLIKHVTHKYLKSNSELPSNTPALITEICKGLNQIIHFNNKNQRSKNLVFPAQTGSAKSLTSQMYISLLEKETSILVMPRIDQAIEAAKNINEWSGNPDYCRCFYKISHDNPHHPLHIYKEDIPKYRSIIITHAMFIKANKMNEEDQFQYADKNNRDLIIVDERLTLNETQVLTKFQLEELEKFLHWHIQVNQSFLFAKFQIDKFKEIFEILEDDFELLKTSILFEHEYNFFDTDEALDFETSTKAFLASNLLMTENHYFKNEEKLLKKKIQIILESMHAMMKNQFIAFKSGNNRSLIALQEVSNKFGSVITLDATAEINKYYHIASQYSNNDIQLVATTRTKQYKNVNIHYANNFYQGRSSIIKNSTYEKETPKYISLIESLLNSGDKILVITSKKFRTYLENHKETYDNIFFTHWGNHIGKNEWKDCNKVIIIGWNYYPQIEYISNILKAANSVVEAENAYNEEWNLLYKFKITQIADDLVQAINRISLRKTIDIEGNCSPCDVYLFGNQSTEYQDVFDLLKFTFQNTHSVQWKPYIERERKGKKTSEKRADEIIERIMEKLKHEAKVLRATIVKESGIPSSSASRIINSKYFKDQCALNNIVDSGENKSKKFTKLQE